MTAPIMSWQVFLWSYHIDQIELFRFKPLPSAVQWRYSIVASFGTFPVPPSPQAFFPCRRRRRSANVIALHDNASGTRIFAPLSDAARAEERVYNRRRPVFSTRPVCSASKTPASLAAAASLLIQFRLSNHAKTGGRSSSLLLSPLQSTPYLSFNSLHPRTTCLREGGLQ